MSYHLGQRTYPTLARWASYLVSERRKDNTYKRIEKKEDRRKEKYLGVEGKDGKERGSTLQHVLSSQVLGCGTNGDLGFINLPLINDNKYNKKGTNEERKEREKKGYNKTNLGPLDGLEGDTFVDEGLGQVLSDSLEGVNSHGHGP